MFRLPKIICRSGKSGVDSPPYPACRNVSTALDRSSRPGLSRSVAAAPLAQSCSFALALFTQPSRRLSPSGSLSLAVVKHWGRARLKFFGPLRFELHLEAQPELQTLMNEAEYKGGCAHVWCLLLFAHLAPQSFLVNTQFNMS